MTATRQMIRYGAAALVVGGAGVVLAQATPLPPTSSWFLSPIEWAAVVALVTQFAKTFFKWSGNAVVIFAFGFSVVGALLAATGVLAVLNIALDANVIEAIIFGLSAGAIAAGGYDVVTTLIEKGRPVTVNAPVVAAPELATGAMSDQRIVAQSTGNPISDFIVMLAQQAVGLAKLPVALVALAPLLTEFAQSSAVLTDDLRSDLQGRVIRLLRSAGLVGVDL